MNNITERTYGADPGGWETKTRDKRAILRDMAALDRVDRWTADDHRKNNRLQAELAALKKEEENADRTDRDTTGAS